MASITARLAADPGCPPPGDAGWTVASVRAILANPKYTGHMVFGRRRHRQLTPESEWLWSPQPAHPAIVSRATWDAAQAIGAEHSSSRDGTGLSSHPAARRTYLLRSRVRCRACRRRMYGMTRTSSRYYTAGPDVSYVYYACPHSRASARHQADTPDHPRNLSIREDYLLTAIRQFFAERIFGPERAALLAAQIPATAAEDQAQRDQRAAALRQREHQINAAENAHAREIESLAHVDDPHAPAITHSGPGSSPGSPS